MNGRTREELTPLTVAARWQALRERHDLICDQMVRGLGEVSDARDELEGCWEKLLDGPIDLQNELADQIREIYEQAEEELEMIGSRVGEQVDVKRGFLLDVKARCEALIDALAEEEYPENIYGLVGAGSLEIPDAPATSGQTRELWRDPQEPPNRLQQMRQQQDDLAVQISKALAIATDARTTLPVRQAQIQEAMMLSDRQYTVIAEMKRYEMAQRFQETLADQDAQHAAMQDVFDRTFTDPGIGTHDGVRMLDLPQEEGAPDADDSAASDFLFDAEREERVFGRHW